MLLDTYCMVCFRWVMKIVALYYVVFNYKPFKCDWPLFDLSILSQVKYKLVQYGIEWKFSQKVDRTAACVHKNIIPNIQLITKMVSEFSRCWKGDPYMQIIYSLILWEILDQLHHTEITLYVSDVTRLSSSHNWRNAWLLSSHMDLSWEVWQKHEH